MPNNNQQLFQALRTYFGEIEGEREKAAGAAGTVKAADRPDGIADPGGYQGKSTHPSADRSVAEHLRPEQTGGRFTEHTSDVKDDVGAGSIENLPEEASSPSKGSGNQDKRQPNIGARNAATGEDTSVERDFKGTKDDPGTSSVMKADDGEKYGSWSMQKFASYLGDLGEEILADITNGKPLAKAAGIGDDIPNRTRKVPNGQPAQSPAKKDGTGEGAADRETKEAAARGYELAAVLGLQDMSPEERTAAMTETIIKEAVYQATQVRDFIHGYHQTLQKAAEGEQLDGGAGEGHANPGDAASGANASGAMGGGPGADDDSGGGGAAGGGADILSQLTPQQINDLLVALQSGQLGSGMGGGMGGGGMGGGMGGGGMGGGGMGGGGMGGGGGGMGGGDAQGALAAMAANGGGGGGGGDPTGGGGGGMDPSGAAGPMGGDPAADLSPEQVDDQLAGSMQDMQLNPEQLEGMASKAGSEQRPYILKIASRVRNHVRSGKFDSTKRANSPAEQQLRHEVKGYLREVIKAAQVQPA